MSAANSRMDSLPRNFRTTAQVKATQPRSFSVAPPTVKRVTSDVGTASGYTNRAMVDRSLVTEV